MSERYVDHVLTKINRRNRKFGDEWPSSDSEDPDYSPDQSSKNTHDSESGGSTDVEEDKCHSVKVTLKRKRTSTARTSSHMKDLDHGSNTDLHRTAGTLLSHVKNNKCHKKSAKRGKIANPNKTKKSTFSTGCSTHSDNTSSVECPHLPPELWLKVFQSVVRNAGPLPFLCRAAKVCRSWHQLCSHPSLWYIVDLSYGWIKSTDATLLWLSQHRLAHCREISLAGWKKLTNSAFVEFCQNSPDLCSVNLSMCGKLTSLAVTALARNCSHLKDLDLSSVSADAVSAQALKQITEKLGPSLKSLVLSGNCFKGFNSVLNSLMDHCVCLERLDLSNCIFSTGTLTLNIECLQTSCPSLQILQLTGCQVWAPQVSQQVQEKAPGFTKLMQLGCSLSANDIFKRLLHNAKQLKTLDVRRSVSILPKTLLECAACDVEELFLSESSIINYPEMLEHLFIKAMETFFAKFGPWWHYFTRRASFGSYFSPSRISSISLGIPRFCRFQCHCASSQTEVQLGIVVGKLVKEFVDKQDFTQELVFEPKVPCCVRRAVATHAAQSGLHMAQRQKEGRLYLALSFKVPMTKVVEAMKSRGLVSAGRYMLVEDRSDLPTHADIVTDLELASKTTKQDWLASRQALKQLDRSSKETGVGISLNGSLFEETLDGFVTAQSLLAESMVSAHQLIQSTPNRKMETEFTDLHHSIVPRAESFPTLCATATAKPEQPTSDMYSKFAAAMVASGIAQTFIPLETVDNILINPPTSSSLGNKTPMIKNILVSPPSSDVRCVMISAPAEDLSPQAIPQPDFSLSSTPTPPSFRSSKDIQGKSPIMKKWESQTSEKCKHSIFASYSNGSAIRTYRTRFEAEESVTTQAESSFLLQGVGAQRLHTKRQNNESDSSIKRGCYGDRNRQFKPQTADHELQKWDERWRWCAQNQAGMPEDCVIQMSPASFIDQGKGWGGFPFESTCMYVENEMVGAHCRRCGPLHNPV